MCSGEGINSFGEGAEDVKLFKPRVNLRKEQMEDAARRLDDSNASIQATNKWMQETIDEMCKTIDLDPDPLAPERPKGANGTGRKKIFGTDATGNG
jgi:hypothetical protein